MSICLELVDATAGYAQSVSNLQGVSRSSDDVFGVDGDVHQLGTVSGDLTTGFLVEDRSHLVLE